MERAWAIITGADGGMGREITKAVAQAGYRVIMACCNLERADLVCERLKVETGNEEIRVEELDLASMASVARFTHRIREQGKHIRLLMNNAGTLETGLHITEDGLERTVSVNYVGHYLLTRNLLPLMGEGSRVVNMVSCTYAIGRIDLPDFFSRGRKGGFWRIPVYGNTKLALLLFTLDLARRVQERGIVVNCADPGVVSTDIITMQMWFDPLTDLFFRPLIRTPRQGADTAIHLLLDEETGRRSGTLNVNSRAKRLTDKYLHHPQMDSLWQATEEIVSPWLQ